ncbi:TPA: fimbrial protein [Serratia odorifera]|nr:fimbrial protein [Serratia odorifera]
MKHNLLVMAMAATAALSLSSAFAADGQINFKGEILDSACQVVNSVSSPLDVTLGKVAKTAFSGAGSTASPTKFTLQLSGCPASVTSATVKFDGPAADGDNGVLALTQESGVATGVGIQLTDASQKVLPLFDESAPYKLTPSTAGTTGGADVVNDLAFIARYVATAATVTAGPANAVANFTVNYN